MKIWLLLLIPILSACSNSEKAPAVSIESGNLLVNSSHGGEQAAWGLADCDACHALNFIHREADSIRQIVQTTGYASCSGCHGSNGTARPRQCVICHNNDDLPLSPVQTGIHSHNFNTDSSSALQDSQCITCHLASDMNGEFNINRDLTRLADAGQLYLPYASTSEFCLRCHNRDHQQTGFQITAEYDDPLIAMEDNHRYIDKHGEISGNGERSYSGLRNNYQYDSLVACTDCHAMHGTNNQGLVIDSSEKGLSRLSPEIKNLSYPINTSDGDYSQLCVICHQMEFTLDAGDLDAGNGLRGVHEINGDCRICHRHGEAVQAGM